ncbi:MAG: hypothetical protein GY938_16670 [Ketobacter sp.]|nr:hypothetical protein [Ketobacter sp.]
MSVDTFNKMASLIGVDPRSLNSSIDTLGEMRVLLGLYPETDVATANELYLQVSSSDRDAREFELSGAVNTTLSFVSMSPVVPTSSAGFVFDGGIPQGVEITTAYIEWYADLHVGVRSPNFNLYCELSTSSDDFDNGIVNGITGRDRTVAYTTFDYGATVLPQGEWFGSGVSSVALVQELVDQVGWTESSPIAFLAISDTGPNGYFPRSYDHDPLLAARLYVEWTAEAGTGLGQNTAVAVMGNLVAVSEMKQLAAVVKMKNIVIVGET